MTKENNIKKQKNKNIKQKVMRNKAKPYNKA